MHWSVEEQTIPFTAVSSPVQSINLRVDPSSSQHCLMELRCEPGEDSYVLRFDRNGALNAVMTVPPPEAPKSEAPKSEAPKSEASASHADAHPKSKK
jgi:hypothetical protein